MPPRSAISKLPTEVKIWLDSALADGGFASYQLLADELKKRGYDISKSSVHRYGQKFEERLAALKTVTEQARAVVEAAPDDDNMINDALTRLVQEKLFTILQEMEVKPGKVNISSLAKAIAELGKSSVTQKKWAAEVRKETEARMKDEAAKTVDRVGKEKGLSTDTISAIKSDILGIRVQA